MFNWFKSKVELKQTKAIMSSLFNKKGFKIGTEIEVPNNFELLIFHKGKHYNTLPSGKYKIDDVTFGKLRERQKKGKYNKKYIKCVCHYININQQSIQIKFKKVLYNITFKVNNTINFANFMLLYTFKVDNDYTLNNLSDLFYELIKYLKGDYKVIQNNHLEKYGIYIDNILPENTKNSIFDKKNKTPTSSSNNIISSKNKSNTVTQSQNLTKTSQSSSNSCQTPQESNNTLHKSNPQAQINNIVYCPKCGNGTRFDVDYCLKCGNKLK